MVFDYQENMFNVFNVNANSRKLEKYCDLVFVIPYVIDSLGSRSNDNYILKEELGISKRIWKYLKRNNKHQKIHQKSCRFLSDFSEIFNI